MISPLCKSVTEVMFWFVMLREWKHWKHSPWACPFSGVRFRVAFHFQKIIFLQLLQIWCSYCFHSDADQLWMHTHKATTRQSVWNRFYWQSKIQPPILELSHMHMKWLELWQFPQTIYVVNQLLFAVWGVWNQNTKIQNHIRPIV